MLSHLRFHKRDRSNPASPVPPDNTYSPWTDLQPSQLASDDGVSSPDVRPRSSHSLPMGQHNQAVPSRPQQPSPQPPSFSQASAQSPPTLPPIPRVASDASSLGLDFSNLGVKPQRDEQKSTPVSPYNELSGFIGGLALRNLRREQEATLRAAQKSPDSASSSAKSPSNFSSRPGALSVQPVKAASSFVSPTDMYKPSTTGKRPPGARIASEPQILLSQGYVPVQEQPRGKKGLPFLKNPVSSLLLRRKTSQHVSDLSIRARKQEPAYDPRIRGTRVHDFSAPRPARVQPQADTLSPGPGSSTDALGISQVLSPADVRPPELPNNSSAVELAPIPEPVADEKPSPETISDVHPALRRQVKTDEASAGEAGARAKRTSMSARRKRGSVPPTISPLSRNASGHSFSAIPKHMKSTSSRFSFDMIGSANEEKLLEERHRQKQADKQDVGVDPQDDGYRDSRFDDFDVDGYDYDDMMDDDGLEERIPGVNADYEEDDGFGGMDDMGYDEEDMGFDQDEQDPDNDQDNFGGFVFQRSDPNSLVTTPLGPEPVLTPRDPGGNVIGYASAGTTPTYPPKSIEGALTVDTIEGDLLPKPLRLSQQFGLDASDSLLVLEPPSEKQDLEKGLLETTEAPQARHLDPNDELCFKSDDFSGEGDGNAFDESLFDLDDTDQFGRPIPGAFASALAQRNTGALDTRKFDSELASRLPAISGASESTAHTSVSVEPREDIPSSDVIEDELLAQIQPQQRPEASDAEREQLAAYQEALAAAARQAAASGKFDRNSPPSATDPTRKPSAAASSVYSTDDNILNPIEDYEADDDAYADLDDYELDDDAIIAEANASALANDSDGWYGQEFGFYAAPSQQQHFTQQQQKAAKSLTEQNLYQYAAGGFFGPSGGLDRSMSGHAVLREPNLTPITERSEYSNRNSIMSLGIPPGIGSAPIQSPGLAQLAMMADDDDMSLSALLRLRSKAWGESQVSLNSREGSPHERNGATSPWSPEPSSTFLGMTSPGARKNSAFSIWSQESGPPDSGAGSPTVTFATPIVPSTLPMPPLLIPISSNTSSTISPSVGAGSLASPPAPSPACPPVFEDDETDEAQTTASISNSSSIYLSSGADSGMMPPPPPPARKTSQSRPAIGHRHRYSADSISYMQQEDSGETRWFLERRRTAEPGEMELFGREVFRGGRI